MFGRRKRSRNDFSAELQSHIALEADRLRAEGLSDAEADSRARRAFGNITCSEERFYESNRVLWLDHLRQDIAYSFRQCGRSKGFTFVAIATLALGIGVNTAIFTLLHAVIFNVLPVYRPAELYRLGRGDNCCVMTGYQNGQDFALFSYDLYKTLREGTPEITNLSAFQAAPQIVSIRRSGSSELGRSFKIEYVSSNYFDLFGLRPALGSFFSPANELRASAPAAVVSYRVWEAYYGRDPSVIGSSFLIKGKPFTLVGVAPPAFYGETLRSDPPDFWLPLATEPFIEGTNNLFEIPGKLWLYVMGRVPPGQHTRELESKINVEAKRWFLAQAGSHLGEHDRRDIEEQFIPLTNASGGVALMSIAYRDALFLLMSLSSLVLLIACANVANLLLARGTALRAQISLRLALGASRGRITRQAFTESVLLSLFGGAAGLALAFATTRLILLLAFRGAHYVPINAIPSLFVLGFAFAISVATGPFVWHSARLDSDSFRPGGCPARRKPNYLGCPRAAAKNFGRRTGCSILGPVDQRRPADAEPAQSGASAFRVSHRSPRPRQSGSRFFRLHCRAACRYLSPAPGAACRHPRCDQRQSLNVLAHERK